jgi:hypothetical protein
MFLSLLKINKIVESLKIIFSATLMLTKVWM